MLQVRSPRRRQQKNQRLMSLAETAITTIGTTKAAVSELGTGCAIDSTDHEPGLCYLGSDILWAKPGRPPHDPDRAVIVETPCWVPQALPSLDDLTHAN